MKKNTARQLWHARVVSFQFNSTRTESKNGKKLKFKNASKIKLRTEFKIDTQQKTGLQIMKMLCQYIVQLTPSYKLDLMDLLNLFFPRSVKKIDKMTQLYSTHLWLLCTPHGAFSMSFEF